MRYFELQPQDITSLSDGDLRELVARLCEAELSRQNIHGSCVTWGGAQEAADDGLDVRVKSITNFSSPNFVPRKNTGIQVKKNAMGEAACKKEMFDNGKIKDVIEELSNRSGAYIIVSGKDDCSEKMLNARLSGMKDAISRLPNKDALLIDFYGRDRLATWLRSHPGVALWVRSKLGMPLSNWAQYGRWAATPKNQDDDFLSDKFPCVIDVSSPDKEPISLAEGIKLTRTKLRHSGSAVRIIGLSGVGKTRFAQALFEDAVGENALPASDVIYADLGDELEPTASELVSYLVANDLTAYVVLDNCPPDVHRKLQEQVSQQGAKLRLLTIEYDISDDRPEETDVIHLEPSSEETVSKLVQRRFPDLGSTNADKIAEFSGGNARVALALASRVEADETLSNFSDEELFKKLFSQRKGASTDLLLSAEILSLVYSFNGAADVFNNELETLSTIGELNRLTLHRSQAELFRRQLTQKRGNWHAILPHALANRLAKTALENTPITNINTQLFKPENLRLFISCAHRLGYLHNFEPAQRLAESWIKPGAPLHDIKTCDEELIKALDYIAPVFPNTVLTSIETAAHDPNFASRSNNHFSKFVHLLKKLAYEDESFYRAALIILKFAANESEGELRDNVVDQLSSLFSLHLSGTQASPLRRQKFVENLMNSTNSRDHEIAKKLFHSAFTASRWSSFSTFEFGARKRGFGWSPKTQKDKSSWYNGFISVLEKKLKSTDAAPRLIARELLASHFKTLWSRAKYFDTMEHIITTYASNGRWPEMWLSIKQTIFYDGEKCNPDLLKRIKALEKLSAPNDLYSEIECYALTRTSDHAEVKGGDYREKVKYIEKKIVEMGILAISNPDLLTRLGSKLWEKYINALWHFGKGLAQGSDDIFKTFEFLVNLMKAQSMENIDPTIFAGFIKAVHTMNSAQAKTLQERVLTIKELKPHFVYLLSATPIVAWGAKKLCEVAKTGELEAWKFEHIGLGRIHEPINDAELSDILRAVNNLELGAFSTLEILEMRFFTDEGSNYVPSAELRSVGLVAIRKRIATSRDENRNQNSYGEDRVVDVCLSTDAPKDEIKKLVELTCSSLLNHQLYAHDIEPILQILVERFPEIILDEVYNATGKEKYLTYYIFDDNFSKTESFLNSAPINRLLDWCDQSQNKVQFLAKAASSYSAVGKKEHLRDNPSIVILSNHIMALLDYSIDKLAVVEIIYADICPSSWSGSRANIMEIRSKAFKALLDHENNDVASFAKEKITQIGIRIHQEQESEAKRNGEREQRFE